MDGQDFESIPRYLYVVGVQLHRRNDYPQKRCAARLNRKRSFLESESGFLSQKLAPFSEKKKSTAPIRNAFFRFWIDPAATFFTIMQKDEFPDLA
jgi:hypothetical protein